MSALLSAEGLVVGYGGVPVVRGLGLELHGGELVALVGPNGGGKSTTLLALSGALPPSAGVVRWRGQVTTSSLAARARLGLGLVTGDHPIFPELTGVQNLKVGDVQVDAVLSWFPELEGHLHRPAGLLSGGQQQMLALGRALARRPDALLVDEPSLGLGPKVIDRLLGALRLAADDGVAVLIAEQHVAKALAVADRVAIMAAGSLVHVGSSDGFLDDPDAVIAAYLGPEGGPDADTVGQVPDGAPAAATDRSDDDPPVE